MIKIILHTHKYIINIIIKYKHTHNVYSYNVIAFICTYKHIFFTEIIEKNA